MARVLISIHLSYMDIVLKNKTMLEIFLKTIHILHYMYVQAKAFFLLQLRIMRLFHSFNGKILYYYANIYIYILPNIIVVGVYPGNNLSKRASVNETKTQIFGISCQIMCNCYLIFDIFYRFALNIQFVFTFYVLYLSCNAQNGLP